MPVKMMTGKHAKDEELGLFRGLIIWIPLTIIGVGIIFLISVIFSIAAE